MARSLSLYRENLSRIASAVSPADSVQRGRRRHRSSAPSAAGNFGSLEVQSLLIPRRPLAAVDVEGRASDRRVRREVDGQPADVVAPTTRRIGSVCGFARGFPAGRRGSKPTAASTIRRRSGSRGWARARRRGSRHGGPRRRRAEIKASPMPRGGGPPVPPRRAGPSRANLACGVSRDLESAGYELHARRAFSTSNPPAARSRPGPVTRTWPIGVACRRRIPEPFKVGGVEVAVRAPSSADAAQALRSGRSGSRIPGAGAPAARAPCSRCRRSRRRSARRVPARWLARPWIGGHRLLPFLRQPGGCFLTRRLFHPWNLEWSPATQAWRSPGVLRSQSGRICRDEPQVARGRRTTDAPRTNSRCTRCG